MEEVKLNFLLVGKTGQGKSATGNTLLNRPGFFKTSANPTPETKDVKFSCRQFEKYMIQVVDGIGWDYSYKDEVENTETAIRQYETAIAMCYGGVSAFLFILKFGQRFTDEERSTLDFLKAIFGNDFMKHVIVVMTGGDLFQIYMEDQESDISFDKWCRYMKDNFLQLYGDCDGRVVLLNNRERDNEKKMEQIQEIVQHADTLQKQNGLYTSQCFANAEKQREKMIVELKVPQLKIEIRQQITLIVANFEKYFQNKNSSESQKNNIIERVKALKREITEQDKGFGVLNEMMQLAEKVERHLNDCIKLKVLAAQLEEEKSYLGALGNVFRNFGLGSNEKSTQQKYDELYNKLMEK